MAQVSQETKMTEAQYKEMIYAKAKEVKTVEQMNSLIAEVIGYKHDYGTIVYGMCAAMLAASRAVDYSPNGGITGFQGGCVGWQMVSEFLASGDKDAPMKLIDYDKLLYPQYASNFDKVISADTFKWLQEKAAKNLTNKTHAHPDVVAHWQSIADGKLPFGFTVQEK